MKKLVCACSKDELDMDCWIDYYTTMGFDIAIYDDNNIPCIKTKKNLFVFKNLFKNKEKQEYFYEFISKKFKNYDWIAMLDCDEYLVWSGNLNKILEEYKEFGGVCPNWVVFGSSGFIKKPSGRVFENFTMRQLTCYPAYKSIIQPKYMIFPVNSHSMLTERVCVSVNKKPVTDILKVSDPSEDKLWINHYFCKSKEHWHNRMMRGSFHNQTRPWELFDFVEKKSNLKSDRRCADLYKKIKNLNQII